MPATSGDCFLPLVIVPERVDELRDCDRVGVVRDKPQDEDTVLPEVLVDELSDNHLPVVVLPQLVDEFQMPLDVLPAPVAYGEADGPETERVERQRGDEQHPEVEKEEDLLVEEVDRQNALDVVAVDGAKTAHFEVAHRDARKSGRRDGHGTTAGPVAADLRVVVKNIEMFLKIVFLQ